MKTERDEQRTRTDAPRYDAVFLACASFEPRSTAVVEWLPPAYKSRKGFIYVNEEFLVGPSAVSTKGNLELMTAKLKEHCAHVEIIHGSWLNPTQQLLAIRTKLTPALGMGNDGLLTLDCSTFHREALIVAGALIRNENPDAHCRVLYAVPQDLGAWLSRGFRCVRNVMGFAGIQRAAKRTVLFLLSGFEGQRALRLIEEHEPNKVFLGIGDPATSISFLERNREEQKLVLARQDVEEFRFPANSIHQCAQSIEALIRDYIDNHNVILAPMSSKLSTLACMTVALRYPQIQVTYCVPGEYNTSEYSEGVKEVLEEELP